MPRDHCLGAHETLRCAVSLYMVSFYEGQNTFGSLPLYNETSLKKTVVLYSYYIHQHPRKYRRPKWAQRNCIVLNPKVYLASRWVRGRKLDRTHSCHLITVPLAALHCNVFNTVHVHSPSGLLVLRMVSWSVSLGRP